MVVNFKNRLRYFMEQYHITAAELSRKSGLSEASINTILRSDDPNPTKSTMEAIANALGISPAMFYIDEDNYVVNIRDFLLPFLSQEEQEFVSHQDSRDFIVLAKELKASDLPAETIKKLIESYVKMSKPAQNSTIE